jgi:hypothetical protein
MRLQMEVPGQAQAPRGRGTLFFLRAALLVVAVPALVVIGYAALSLQGHQEDFPSKPMQTWPIGVTSLALAAALAWAAARPWQGLQPLLLVTCLALFVSAWATFLL